MNNMAVEMEEDSGVGKAGLLQKDGGGGLGLEQVCPLLVVTVGRHMWAKCTWH